MKTLLILPLQSWCAYPLSIYIFVSVSIFFPLPHFAGLICFNSILAHSSLFLSLFHIDVIHELVGIGFCLKMKMRAK